jgi:hypothetical protein
MKNIYFQQINGFKIEYIHLPYSWYNVTSASNAIRINGTNTASITPGQYNASSLASALQTALQVVDATFTVTFSSITNNFTIARSMAFVMNLSSPLFTMKRTLGFNAKVDTASATSQNSDSVVFMQNGNSISLHSDILSKALDNHHSDNRDEYVMSIPVDANPGDLIGYFPPNRLEFRFKSPINISNYMTLYLPRYQCEY